MARIKATIPNDEKKPATLTNAHQVFNTAATEARARHKKELLVMNSLQKCPLLHLNMINLHKTCKCR